jgi:hypothetical protein
VSTSVTDLLGRKAYLTLIVRLLVDENNRLVGGEVVDVEEEFQAPLRGWQDVLPAIRDYLHHRARRTDGAV